MRSLIADYRYGGSFTACLLTQAAAHLKIRAVISVWQDVCAMSRFCRIIVIFSLVAALLGFPHSSIAAPLETLIPAASTSTTQVSEADFFKRGTYKVMAGDFQGAIAALTSAIQINPKNADAYTNQGLARAGIGDRHGAIADYTSAIQLNPSLALAYYKRGFVLSQLQDYQGAIEDLSRAIQLNP